MAEEPYPCGHCVRVPAQGEYLVRDGRVDKVAETDMIDSDSDHYAYTVYIERDPEPCPYTHSHTRHWCGNVNCRES